MSQWDDFPLPPESHNATRPAVGARSSRASRLCILQTSINAHTGTTYCFINYMSSASHVGIYVCTECAARVHVVYTPAPAVHILHTRGCLLTRRSCNFRALLLYLPLKLQHSQLSLGHGEFTAKKGRVQALFV